MLRIFLLIFVFGLFLGCDEEPLEDTEEQLCSQASGTWAISSITCGGTAQTIGTMSIALDHSAGTVTHSEGGTDCSATSTFASVFDFSSSVQLTGSGTVSCVQNGSDVNSCTGAEISCDNTTSINGLANDYTQCVVANETTMTLTRTVSSQHITDGMTTCTEGQSEVLTLVPQNTTPTASLVISDGTTYDYGNVNNGSSSNFTFTVTNAGTGPASVISASGLTAPFQFLGGSYPGTGGTCATSLAVASTCTLVVDFSPTISGVFVDSIELGYNDGSASQTASRALQGTGVTGGPTALLTISETDPYDYGSVSVGGNAFHNFTVTNTGAVTATSIAEIGLAAPFQFLGGSYPGTGGNCGASLAAAANCTLVVAFSPVAAGVAADSLELMYNNGSANVSVTRDIQGTGVTPALLFISNGPTYDFGNVPTGNNSNFAFTVTNTGGTTATSIFGSGLAAPYTFRGGAYPGTGGTCTTILTAGANCMIDVEFSPIIPGAANDTIQLDYNDGSAAQQTTRDITGTGI